MIVSTITITIRSARMADTDAVPIMLSASPSALVIAYFGYSVGLFVNDYAFAGT